MTAPRVGGNDLATTAKPKRSPSAALRERSDPDDDPFDTSRPSRLGQPAPGRRRPTPRAIASCLAADFEETRSQFGVVVRDLSTKSRIIRDIDGLNAWSDGVGHMSALRAVLLQRSYMSGSRPAASCRVEAILPRGSPKLFAHRRGPARAVSSISMHVVCLGKQCVDANSASSNLERALVTSKLQTMFYDAGVESRQVSSRGNRRRDWWPASSRRQHFLFMVTVRADIPSDDL